MKPVVCARESEVLDAVLGRRLDAGAWEARDAADSGSLAAHVAGCAICRDVITVARAMREDREWMRGELPVPAPGQVWWRAAVRARLEATQAAARPLTWAHGATAAAAAGAAVAAAGFAWPTMKAAATWAGQRILAAAPAAPDAATMEAMGRNIGLAVALAAVAVVTPVILYLAFAED